MSVRKTDVVTKAASLLKQKDRRRNKRVELELDGKFMSDSGHDHSLRTKNISCGGALVEAAVRPPEGTKLVCYFDDFGRVSTTVVRHTPDGFALAFTAPPHKRDKLADRLTWLANKDKLGLSEDRQSPRLPASGPAIIIRADGLSLQCTVMDISLTGASFKTSGPPPMVGEHVKVGNLDGEVMRRVGQTFAIRYLRASDSSRST